VGLEGRDNKVWARSKVTTGKKKGNTETPESRRLDKKLGASAHENEEAGEKETKKRPRHNGYSHQRGPQRGFQASKTSDKYV